MAKKSAIFLIVLSLLMVASSRADEELPTGIKGTKIVVIANAGKDFRGLAIVAPHEGFDTNTSKLLAELPKTIGGARVFADGFREREQGRYINVNRPTEEPFVGGRFGAETETKQARDIYTIFQSAVLHAGGVKEQLALHVELHGNSRKVKVSGKDIDLDVIECATTGFSEVELRKLLSVYESRRASLPMLYFEGIPAHRTYNFKGTTVGFYFGAHGAKKDGTMQKDKTLRALHFELPRSVRFKDVDRRALATALGGVITEAWKFSKPR